MTEDQIITQFPQETFRGEFKRQKSVFRELISADSIYKPEKERYHLYLSHACPSQKPYSTNL